MSKRNMLLFINEYVTRTLKAIGATNDETVLTGSIKRWFIDSVVRHYARSDVVKERIKLAREISQKFIDALYGAGFYVVVIDAKLVSPGIVGISSGPLHGVLEVGISWDYVIDVPFIPASSIKGCVRSFVELYCNECDDIVGKLFGLGGEGGVAGLLIFLDAYPIKAGEPPIEGRDGRLRGFLEPDIVTPHYFSGGKAIDFEYNVRPVQVPQVCIARGTVFRFIVGIEPSSDAIESLNKLLETLGGSKSGSNPGSATLALLKHVFRYGIGARTSRGYGLFEIERFSVSCGGGSYSTPVLFHPRLKRKGRRGPKGGDVGGSR